MESYFLLGVLANAGDFDKVHFRSDILIFFTSAEPHNILFRKKHSRGSNVVKLVPNKKN